MVIWLWESLLILTASSPLHFGTWRPGEILPLAHKHSCTLLSRRTDDWEFLRWISTVTKWEQDSVYIKATGNCTVTHMWSYQRRVFSGDGFSFRWKSVDWEKAGFGFACRMGNLLPVKRVWPGGRVYMCTWDRYQSFVYACGWVHKGTACHWFVAEVQLFELAFVQSCRHLSRLQISPFHNALFFTAQLVHEVRQTPGRRSVVNMNVVVNETSA